MISALCAGILLISTQVKINYLSNPGFEDGLAGWSVKGDAIVSDQEPIRGKRSLVLGKGGGSVTQRYKVPGERILWMWAFFKGESASIKGRIIVTCIDNSNDVLMSLSGAADPVNGAGIYFKSHPYTDHITVKIEKIAGPSESIDIAELNDEERGKVAHKSLLSIETAMQPFWKGNTVYSEPILLLSRNGSPPSGKLLFEPQKILSVNDPALGLKYKEGIDYTLKGYKIFGKPGSKIPTMGDNEFQKGNLPWTSLDGRHVFVTYRHSSKWPGLLPSYQGERLPGLAAKLKAKRPVTLVAYGDSITLGTGGSGIRQAPPYVPSWPVLLAKKLGNVKLHNVALGGQNSYWARDNARQLVANLSPDLVLIAFGMNDFWSITPAEFKANILEAVARIRKEQPDCEFVLISPMAFDPEYTQEKFYLSNIDGYASELASLAGPGVAFFDMTALSKALYAAKSFKDLASDPMHPNDFLARCYAQGVFATITKK